MENWICITCGTQFPKTVTAPSHCPTCEDERQYIGHRGQRWTTLEQMRHDGYRNAFYEYEPNLWAVETVPEFAIGQHAGRHVNPRRRTLCRIGRVTLESRGRGQRGFAVGRHLIGVGRSALGFFHVQFSKPDSAIRLHHAVWRGRP